jgi:glycine cleavage system protein P-like pyridoxal-binding family
MAVGWYWTKVHKVVASIDASQYGVYIDDRTGKLLDAGVERTLISCPLALSFQLAIALLDGSLENAEDLYLAKMKAILVVAERNLKLWSESHRERNKAAKAREEHLAAQEMVGQELYGNKRG